MIAPIKKRIGRKHVPAWHEGFLAMLPVIERHAKVAFRDLDPEARQEAVQEVIANTLVAFIRLVELDKSDLAYPTVLARYAVAQVRDGRRVGNRLNVRDVSSPYAQMRKGFQVERLDRYDKNDREWLEILVEDRHATPADVAASRLDFAAWLKSLSSRYRKIATTLATGETTGRVAQMFRLSNARISQLRRELRDSWRQFQGEYTVAGQAAGTAA